jgi:trans-aconitate methyltransferase
VSTNRSSGTFNWNPAAYAANSSSQQAWARERMATLSLRGCEHILDVGCGDGKITAELARAVPDGSATGIDSSPEMIRFARQKFLRATVPEPRSGFTPSPGLRGTSRQKAANSGGRALPSAPGREFLVPPYSRAREQATQEAFPNLEFYVMDARRIRFARRFDIVFSNAALHWVDDHRAFLRAAAGVLRQGGLLTVSCGGKGNAHDVFLALRSELRLMRWRPFFRKMAKPYFFYSPEEYRIWLGRFGFRVQSLRLAEKDMVWQGAEGFAGWLRTTWHPYMDRVPSQLREQFILAVTDRYLDQRPPDAEGRVHVRMVRLEMEARKSN